MSVKFDKNGLAISGGDVRVFYFYDDTKEYAGWSDEYINIGVSMPANSTLIDPGDKVDGKASVFTGSKWKTVPDHRGEMFYSTQTGEAVEATELGDPPKDATTIKPSGPYDVWDGKSWVTDHDALHAAEVLALESERKFRLNDANEYMNSRQWPGKAALGRLKGDDIIQYNQWLDYLDALEALQIESHDEITWPVEPEKQGVKTA